MVIVDDRDGHVVLVFAVFGDDFSHVLSHVSFASLFVVVDIVEKKWKDFFFFFFPVDCFLARRKKKKKRSIAAATARCTDDADR